MSDRHGFDRQELQVIEASLGGWMRARLPAARWFGAKARPLADVVVLDVAPLPDAGRHAFALLETRYASDAGPDVYALVVGAAEDAAADAVIGRLDTRDGPVTLVEAGGRPGGALALLRGFATSASIPTRRGGRLEYADVSEEAATTFRRADAGDAVRAVGHEQSNSSVRVGRTFVFKLIRRLDSGESPEVEIGRFLASRTSFRATAPLHGSLTYESPTGHRATVGVLQGWVDNQGDGWTYLLNALARVDRHEARADAPIADLRRLGSITADFHHALAGGDDPAFAPQQVTAGDIKSWTDGLHDRIGRVGRLLRAHSADWPPGAASLAAQFTALTVRADAIALPGGSQSGEFDAIRVHGDYHLGQTLKTRGGFVLIDFEGEPARPLVERRGKTSALKDVAGMLRSIDYARASVSPAGALTTGPMRQAFLDGYRASPFTGPARPVPVDPRAFARWLRFFELDKAVYEVEYEANNRPSWLEIPLRGVVRLLGGQVT